MFAEMFAFRDHALVDFVGGGGKTRLIRALASECCSRGPVLMTTTTRNHPPDPAEGISVISGDNVALVREIVARIGRECAGRPHKLLAARHFFSPHLLRGVPPDFADGLDRAPFPVLLNEADGAAGFSLKLPRDSEPVPMRGADYLVPVVGMDCLGRPLGPDTVFRWELFAGRFELRAGETITPGTAARILMHPEGVCRGSGAGTEIIPFINKADSPAADADARALGGAILENGHFPVSRVLYGSAAEGRVQCLQA